MTELKEMLTAAGDAVRSMAPMRPKVCLVLGSGYRDLAEMGGAAVRVPVEKIPGFPRPRVSGHGSDVALGKMAGVPTLVYAGRKHLYEGEGLSPVIFPILLARTLGCSTLILSNAAGGAHPEWEVGDLMLICDHLDSTFHAHTRDLDRILESSGLLVEESPLGEVYDPERLESARRVGRKLGIPLREGTYVFSLGPFYESKAEVRALSRLGGDAFGMSTVPEALAGRRLGMRVTAVSGITNLATGIASEAHRHETVVANAGRIVPRMSRFLQGFLTEMNRPAERPS